jgi:uncharacterized membrane protein YtjA (UPF0391 family)
MLRAAIIFFALGIVSMFLGINNIAGLSIDIGKILLFVFLILSVVSLLVGRSKRNILMMMALLVVTGHNVRAEENSISGTAKEVASDTRRAAENAVRVTKDKTCRMINGKMACAVQKAKHVMQKVAAEGEDLID